MPKLTQFYQHKIVFLLQQGNPQSAICQKLGISQHYVQYDLKNKVPYGISFVFADISDI